MDICATVPAMRFRQAANAGMLIAWARETDAPPAHATSRVANADCTEFGLTVAGAAEPVTLGEAAAFNRVRQSMR